MFGVRIPTFIYTTFLPTKLNSSCKIAFFFWYCCVCLQISDCEEQRNRDTIWQACHDFGSAESMFSRC